MTAAVDGAPRPTPVFWLTAGSRVVVVCAFVALFLCLLERGFAHGIENLVYSEAIGLSIFAGDVALRAGRIARGNFRFGVSLWRGLITVPVGFLVGSVVATLLLERRLRIPSFQTSPFLLAISGVTSVCVMYFFWSRGRLADAARTEAEARRTTAEARLKLLQAQIEPHMLFNTLANLRTLVDGEPQRAQAMIDQLIVYLRGTLAASRSATTTLADEFAQLTAYLELMEVRMATRLQFSLILPDALRTDAIPPMLLQPLVENAIRHGLEPKIAGGSIRVIASAPAGRLRVDVCDDGIGLDADVEPTGYGLEHVRDRLRVLYGDAASLSIAAGPDGGVIARAEWPR